MNILSDQSVDIRRNCIIPSKGFINAIFYSKKESGVVLCCVIQGPSWHQLLTAGNSWEKKKWVVIKVDWWYFSGILYWACGIGVQLWRQSYAVSHWDLQEPSSKKDCCWLLQKKMELPNKFSVRDLQYLSAMANCILPSCPCLSVLLCSASCIGPRVSQTVSGTCRATHPQSESI